MLRTAAALTCDTDDCRCCLHSSAPRRCEARAHLVMWAAHALPTVLCQNGVVQWMQLWSTCQLRCPHLLALMHDHGRQPVHCDCAAVSLPYVLQHVALWQYRNKPWHTFALAVRMQLLTCIRTLQQVLAYSSAVYSPTTRQQVCRSAPCNTTWPK